MLLSRLHIVLGVLRTLKNMEEDIIVPSNKSQHCNKTYIKQKRLTQHIKQEHTKTEDGELITSMEEDIKVPSNKCQHCNKTYSQKKYLTQHIKRAHTKNEDGEPISSMEEDIKVPSNKCQHCNKTYIKKKHLTQHIKRAHTKNEDGEPITRVGCTLCNKSFYCNSTLQRHIKGVHLSLNKAFLCDKCAYTTNYKCNLEKHLRKVHCNASNIPKKMYPCSSCFLVFVQKKQLKWHRIKEHNVQVRKQIKRKCPLCSFTSNCKTRIEINTHFSKVHDITLRREKYHFDSMDEFSRWKDDLEKQTMTFYKKHRYSQKTVNYECHRRGNFKRSGETRKLKINGSCKINGYCPSEVRATTNDNGNVSVVYVATHVGHTNQLKFARFTTMEKQRIAQLLQKTPHEEILKKLRNSMTSPNSQRLLLTRKKDIVNIENSLNLNGEAERHQFDPVSVEAWVQELRYSKDTALIMYKPQGRVDETFPELKEEDFLLIYVTEAQKAFLKCYGRDTVCIDGTCIGLNNYNFQLYTLHTVDECREGFPCAFMFASRGDVSVLSLFFRAIKDITGPIQTNVFMSDMEESFYAAWTSTMGPSNLRLSCTWHVLKAWRTNLNKIKSKTKRDCVYKILKSLLYELDVEAFHKIMSSALDTLHSDPETKEYSEYFSGQYITNEKYRHWAYCYRTGTGINTNMSLENFNKILKYCYGHLKEEKVQRLDKTICAILDLIKDKLYDCLIKMESGKLQDIRYRHKRALSIPSENVVQDDNKWNVLSSEGTEIYAVKKVQQCKKCRLQCLRCNSCFHEFICTCMDNSIKNNMCKHIHAVARNLPVEEPTQGDPETQLVFDDGQNFQEEPTLQEEISEINSDSFDKKTEMIENVEVLLNLITTNEDIDFVNKRIKTMIADVNTMKLSVSENPSPKESDPVPDYQPRDKPEDRVKRQHHDLGAAPRHALDIDATRHPDNTDPATSLVYDQGSDVLVDEATGQRYLLTPID